MKKYLLAIGLFLIISPAFAQLTPGRVFTGTHFGGSIKRDDTSTKTTTISISPMAAYVLSPHWMLGVQATASSTRSESDIRTAVPVPISSGYAYYTTYNTIKTKSTTTGFGPMARYYTTLGPRLAFFAEGTVSYMKTKYKLDSEMAQFIDPGTGAPAGSPWGTPSTTPVSWNTNSNENSQSSINGALAPGLVYFPTPKLGIELKANWFKYTYTDKGNEFDADPSLAKATVGAGFYF